MQTERVGPDAREQLLGGAGQQGPAQPVEPRRDLRQPHGDRRDRRATTTGTAPRASTGGWGIGEAVDVQRFVARTQTPGCPAASTPSARHSNTATARSNRNLSYTEVGDDFNPEVGFLERPDGYRQSDRRLPSECPDRRLAGAGSASGGRTPATRASGASTASQETATLHIDIAWDFENGYFVSPALNVQYEGLREPFEVYPGVIVPAGSYRSPHRIRRWQHRSPQVDFGQRSTGNFGGFLSGSQEASRRR